MRNSDVILKCNMFKPFPPWKRTYEERGRTVFTKLQTNKQKKSQQKNKQQQQNQKNP